MQDQMKSRLLLNVVLDDTKTPIIYKDLANGFDIDRISTLPGSLPPHCPYGIAINFQAPMLCFHYLVVSTLCLLMNTLLLEINKVFMISTNCK